MKCRICDKELTEKEIVYNDEIHEFEPCTHCLDIIMDAAYSSRFRPEDDDMLLDESFDDDEDYSYYGTHLEAVNDPY